jgi:hypothetical protein
MGFTATAWLDAAAMELVMKLALSVAVRAS